MGLIAINGSASELTEADIPEDMPPDLKQLVEQTFSPDIGERMAAARRIGEMHERAAAAAPFLIRITRDLGGDRTFPACEALVSIGEPALDACIAAAKAPSRDIGYGAILCLGRFRSPRALDTLVELLESPDHESRRTALIALDGCTDERITIPVLGALQSGDYETKALVAGCFKNLRDERSVRPLLAVLEAGAGPLEEHAVPRLRATIQALGWQRDPRAVPALGRILENSDESDWLRHDAAISLAYIGERSTMPTLVEIVQNRALSSITRSGAVLGVGAYRPSLTIAESGQLESARDDARMLYLMSGILNNEDESVDLRVAAAQAMGDFGNPKAVKTLTVLASSGAPDSVRFWAAISVVRLTDGRIDNDAVKTAIENYRSTDNEGSGLDREAQRDALKKISEHGMSAERYSWPTIAALIVSGIIAFLAASFLVRRCRDCSSATRGAS